MVPLEFYWVSRSVPGSSLGRLWAAMPRTGSISLESALMGSRSMACSDNQGRDGVEPVAGEDKKKTDAVVDEDVVRSLARLLDETRLTEIEIEQRGWRVRVARQAAV